MKVRAKETNNILHITKGKEYSVVKDEELYYVILDDEYEESNILKDRFEPIEESNHYDNTNGSLYKFAQDHKLNAWEFDAIKRIVRCRKKGQWLSDINKTIKVLELYKEEYRENER